MKLDEANFIVNCTMYETTLEQIIFCFLFFFPQMLFDIDFDIYHILFCMKCVQHLKKISLLPAPEGIPPTLILLSLKAKSDPHAVA